MAPREGYVLSRERIDLLTGEARAGLGLAVARHSSLLGITDTNYLPFRTLKKDLRVAISIPLGK